ncbi:MAG: NUDIX domain-containing protein [Candidatus Aenigmatarchaeota archaeon]
MRTINKCALFLIRNKKLLLSREPNDNRFLTIGGKFEEGENDLQCLQRELIEEVGTIAKEETLKFMNEFSYETGEMSLHIRAYTGELKNEPHTTKDIEELKWFSRENLEAAPVEIVTPITKQKILPFLIERGLI